jgi:hypothetical protein
MVIETLKRQPDPSRRPPRPRITFEKSVRSIQRLPAVPQKSCTWIAQEYLDWLPTFFPFLIRVEREIEPSQVSFYLTFFWKPLLTLKAVAAGDPSRKFEDDRIKFFIVGGLLSKTTTTGWLEFRQIQHRRYTLAAIHEFIPALPWMIYLLTQAPLHRVVMGQFGNHLRKQNTQLSDQSGGNSMEG